MYVMKFVWKCITVLFHVSFVRCLSKRLRLQPSVLRSFVTEPNNPNNCDNRNNPSHMIVLLSAALQSYVSCGSFAAASSASSSSLESLLDDDDDDDDFSFFPPFSSSDPPKIPITNDNKLSSFASFFSFRLSSFSSRFFTRSSAA